jgi:hypothetical protein
VWFLVWQFGNFALNCHGNMPTQTCIARVIFTDDVFTNP